MATAINVQQLIIEECDAIKEMVLEKNRKYGNSALEPIRVFSKEGNIAGLNIRIDDKLSRIKNLEPDDQEDSGKDLIGYLVLRQIARKYPGYFEKARD